MPKTKAHSATKKRFRLTSSGKLVRRHGMKSHLLEHKSAKRKRGVTNKRVSNTRIKTRLGWQPKFPTFREGFAEEIRRVSAALDEPKA